eukprot:GFUD01032205.1.p1 GENE.GFUD01032205.1~~GFUD01032205.1.p1  ORF type:complete len:373 (+),score=123.66 GFUD01032205.1:251-1369(+)
MAPGEDLNLPVETGDKLEEENVPEIEDQEVAAELENEERLGQLSSTSEVAEILAEPVLEEAANTLAVTTELVNEERLEQLSPTPEVAEMVTKPVLEEAADTLAVTTELVNEEGLEQLSSTPEVAEVLTQPLLEEAADTLAVTTVENVIESVENVIESVISEFVDTSSGIETIGVIEETECEKRDSTFLTEIEDTEEIVTKQESTEEINQLEKTILESNEQFSIEESIGEIEEPTPPIEDKITFEVESIEEEPTPPIEDKITFEVESIEEATREIPKDPEELIETAMIEATETIIHEDILAVSEPQIVVTEAEAIGAALSEEVTEAEVDIIADKDSIRIVTGETKNTEKIPVHNLSLVAFVVFMALFVFVYTN